MPAVVPAVHVPPGVVIDAVPVELLAHVPPAGVLVRVVDAPSHNTSVPPMAVGNAFTVTTAVVVQPVPSEYVMFTVPAVPPVTTPPAVMLPVPLPGVSTHVPPAGVVVNVVVPPAQTCAVPPMVPGNAFTVTTADDEQPPCV